MKKMMIATLIFTAFFSQLAAPPAQSLVIIMPEPINPYETIWTAVCKIESGFNPMAYNPAEHAFGISQIRDIRLNDYNTRAGKKVPLIALFDVKTSKTIFMYYISQIDYRDIKAMAICWNGVSKRNLYYGKLKAAL